MNRTLGGLNGYVSGILISNLQVPPSYGVSGGPNIVPANSEERQRKLIKQFNELKPTLKTMGKGTGEKVYTTKPFTLEEWLNAGPERRKIGRMNKEQYLEYRTKMSKSAKAFKKKEF